jgi:hypothetical protein
MEDEPFSLGRIISNEVHRQRDEKMKSSPQLTLGELILKLEAIQNKKKPIWYDFWEKILPGGVGSWRGSYNEFAIEYGISDIECLVENLLLKLKDSVGKTFEGYKGGDFTMGRTTPVWVANYGESAVSKYKEDKRWVTVGIIGITEKDDKVIIDTKEMEY